jgi:hypothetical protein
MALRQRRGPLVELPAGFPASDSIAQFQTIYHRRRLLNGYGSYFPAEMPSRLELIRKLPDAGALALLRRDTEVETIVVHARALDPASRRAWDGVFRDARHRHGMRLAARIGDVYVFDVEGELTAGRGSGAAASP